MRTSSLLVLPVVALSFIGLAGCGSDSETTSAATTSAAVTASPSAGTAADYSPIPSPASREKGLDFGKLTKITTVDGVITLHVDREKYYTGDEAEAAAKRNGEPLLDDYYADDLDGDQELTFILDPKASIQATAGLSSNGEQADSTETLTSEQLAGNLKKLHQATGDGPLVWLRHLDGADGPVTAIVDQFVP